MRRHIVEWRHVAATQCHTAVSSQLFVLFAPDEYQLITGFSGICALNGAVC